MQIWEEAESWKRVLLPAHQEVLLGTIDDKHQHSSVHRLEASGPCMVTLQTPAPRTRGLDVSLKLHEGMFYGF